MSIKTNAEQVRDETVSNQNTALRVGGVLVEIADDLIVKESAISLNTNKRSYPIADETKLSGIEAGAKADQTGAEIKSLYEAQANTNVFTDTEKSKLGLMTANFTSSLKALYDSASSWVTSNGANVLNHLTSLANPHSVTKAQVGLSVVDNTADTDKPVSTAQQTALNSKQDTLVSGTNIKTINGESLLGGTNIVVTAGDVEGTAIKSSGETGGSKFLREDGDGTSSWQLITGGGDALTSSPLSQFAPTTKAQLNGVISDGTPLYVGDVDTNAIDLNTAKVGVTAQMVSDIDTNNLKVGITTQQASDITTNNAKVGITTQQASDITTNNAKVTYPSADSTKLGLIEDGATNDTTSTIQTKRPLKTVNGESLEGSGDIVVAGGGQPDVVVEDLAVTGTKVINWNSGETYRLTLTGAVVLSESNLVSVGKSEIITLYVDGDFALTLPASWDTYKTGTYDGTVLNTITVEYVNATTPFHKVTIIQ